MLDASPRWVYAKDMETTTADITANLQDRLNEAIEDAVEAGADRLLALLADGPIPTVQLIDRLVSEGYTEDAVGRFIARCYERSAIVSFMGLRP